MPRTCGELREAASLLPALMNRGTKSLTYQQLRDEMNRLDVQVGAGGGGFGGRGGRGGGGGGGGSAGSVAFSVRAKRDTLPAALDLLRQILREPALDGKELELMKPSRIAVARAVADRSAVAGLGPLVAHAQPLSGRRHPRQHDARRGDRPHQGRHDRPGPPGLSRVSGRQARASWSSSAISIPSRRSSKWPRSWPTGSRLSRMPASTGRRF